MRSDGLRSAGAGGWHRAREWLLPDAVPVPASSDREVEALAAEHQELSHTVRNILHVLAGVCLFCVIALGSPDTNLVASPTITIPLLNYAVSFTAFLLVGPVLIGGLTLYLHVFYASLLEVGNRLQATRKSGPALLPPRVPKAAAVFNVDNWAGAALTWLLFYWAPPLVLGVFAWRAVPLDMVGPATFALAAALTLVMIALQIRRSPRRWRPWALPVLLAGGLVMAGLLAFTVARGRVPIDRRMDLRKADFSGKDLRDLNLGGAMLQEARLTKADLRRARLADAHLQGADLSDTRFDPAAVQSAKSWILAAFSEPQLLALGIPPTVHATLLTEKWGAIDLSSGALPPVDLREADLSGFDLRGVQFGRADLAGAKLTGAQLQSADLTSVRNLSIAQLETAKSWSLAYLDPGLGVGGYDLEKVRQRDLTGADLRGRDLRGAQLAGFNLRKANLSGADLTDATFHDDVRGGNEPGRASQTENRSGGPAWPAQPGDSSQRANLEGANLQRIRIDQVKAAELKQANNWMFASYSEDVARFLGLPADHGDRLARKDFSRNDLLQQGVSQEDSSHRECVQLNASQKDFYEANLPRGNFAGIDLSTWNFEKACLNGANLAGVKLRGARLVGSDLTSAHLKETDLTDADLGGAILERADLTGALLSCDQLWQAIGWESTTRSTRLTCDRRPPLVSTSPATPTKPPVPVPAPPGSVASGVRYDRSKPHLNLVALGETGNGTSTLISAIRLRTGAGAGAPPGQRRGSFPSPAFAEFTTATRHYAVAYSATHRDLLASLVTGTAQGTGGLLVLSAVNGVSAETREQVRIAHLSGVEHLVVFLNGVDRLKDSARAAADVRALLKDAKYSAETPIVRGTAVGGTTLDPQSVKVVDQLLAALDAHVPTPPRTLDRSFLMPVEDVFSIAGRGVIVTGRIERGTIKEGDLVDVLGFTSRPGVRVTGVEMFRKLLREGMAGDNVGLVLGSVTKQEFERGQVVAASGSMITAPAFRAEAYFLDTAQEGRQTPVLTGYRPQIYLRTTDVTGTITLEGTQIVQPGGFGTMRVDLARELALEARTRFAIREGGRTVGAGFVTDIIR